MPTAETAYKNRVSRIFEGIVDNLSVNYFATAIGVGAKSGMPDKWYQIGHVPIMIELKKKNESARKLQSHQLKKLREHGFIAFCTSAQPDSTGVKGQERQEIYREILEQIAPEKVDAFVLNYVSDAKRLRQFLESKVDPDAR